MDDIVNVILGKLNDISMDGLSETLPTTVTSDAHIIKGIQYYTEENLWKAFHHLSLTHSTLLYHKFDQKLFQSTSNSQQEDLNNTFISQDRTSEKIQNHRNEEENFLPTRLAFFGNHTVLRTYNFNDTKTLIKLLPSDWTVIQVSSENRMSGTERIWRKSEDPLLMPPLYVSRCTCGKSPSIIMKKINPPKHQNSLRSILQELESIKGENKVISKYYADDYNKYLLKREEINNRLRVLVQSMEVGWLRYFTSLFIGSLSNKQQNRLEKMVREALQDVGITMSDEDISFLILMICYPVPIASNNSILSYDFPLKAGIASLLNESVRCSKVKALEAAISKIQNTCQELRTKARGPVILVLDKSVVSLPWEMISSLRDQPVSRMPSFHSLVQLYLFHVRQPDSVLIKGINASNGYFILDPEGNLTRSQERLKETFKLTKWEGVTARKPSHDAFKDALETKDLFVYVGHGSGSQYMPSKIVESVACRSVVMLYGCASVSLGRRGVIPDPWGVILNYLIASCPCVVGMLWEVMDKDTDLLTREIVRAILGQEGSLRSILDEPSTLLPFIVAKARPLCSWYLISAALVVYGLPLRVKSTKDDQKPS